MNTTDFIRSSLQTSRGAVLGMIMDLKDKPFAQPTASGGNHALWILGHLTVMESAIINGIMLGNESTPYDQWKPLFGMKSEPSTDGSIYPTFDELLDAWEEVRANTLKVLDALTDDDLDKPSLGCPEEWSSWFGTYGKVFATQIFHPTMHYGQLSDIRKTLGRELLMV